MRRVEAEDIVGWQADQEDIAEAEALIARYYGANPPSIGRAAIVRALYCAWTTESDADGSRLVRMALAAERD